MSDSEKPNAPVTSTFTSTPRALLFMLVKSVVLLALVLAAAPVLRGFATAMRDTAQYHVEGAHGASPTTAIDPPLH